MAAAQKATCALEERGEGGGIGSRALQERRISTRQARKASTNWRLSQLEVAKWFSLSQRASPTKRGLTEINEAVAVYRLSRSTLYKLIANGTLRTVKIAGRRLVPRDAIEALFEDGAK